MQQTILHNHILEKNLNALKEALDSEKPEVVEELNSQGHSFKTLAVKTLNPQEFEVFCHILEKYYLNQILKQKPQCLAGRCTLHSHSR